MDLEVDLGYKIFETEVIHERDIPGVTYCLIYYISISISVSFNPGKRDICEVRELLKNWDEYELRNRR